MKLKYLIISTFLLLILTGCTADYNLKVNKDNTLEETIKFDFQLGDCQINDDYFTVKDCEKVITDDLNDQIIEEKYPKYNIQFQEKSDGNLNVILKYKYRDLDEFKNSKTYNMAFENKKIRGNKLILEKINDPSEGLVIEDLTLTIDSDYFIKSTNATKKEITKGKYTWNFKKDDKGKDVKFKITNKENWVKKHFEDKPLLFYCLVSMVSVALLVILIFIIYQIYVQLKSKRS